MNSNNLTETAKKLESVSQEVVTEYHYKMEKLVASVNAKMLDRKDVEQLIGSNNKEMMKDNHANHARFIYSIIYKPNPEVLVNSVLWVFKTYRSHGFSENYWTAQLNCWMAVLQEQLSTQGYKQIAPLYNWLQTNIAHFIELSNKQIQLENS